MYESSECDQNDYFLEKLKKCSSGHMIYAAPNQKIFFQEKMQSYLYIIQNGIIDVKRKNDDIIVLTLKKPTVLGLTSIFSNVYYHYLCTVTESQIFAIKRTAALEYINRENLWCDASKILCQAAQLYYQRDEVVSGSTVYEIIRNHLEILWEYSPQERSRISVFDFIMGRSKLSRSSLNKVLKDLTLGGYVVLHRGKLVDLKKLPRSY